MRCMHLVDTTLFYSPTSGGVKRYLSAKHAWLHANTSWRHSILVPGDRPQLEPGGISTIRGYRVPGTFNYRLPLAPRRWVSLLDELKPDLLEAGDAFHPAWAAWRVAQRRNIPLAAFFHSNLPQIIGRRIGQLSERAVGSYVRWLYRRFDIVFAPSLYMCSFLESLGVRNTSHQPLGVDAEVFHPARPRIDVRTKLGLAPGTRLLVFAGRFAGEKNLPVLMQAFNLLGSPYHLLLIGGGREGRIAANVTVMPYRRDASVLAAWIASCDALVHAGTRETFGLVILEAMACGRPVVAANAGAIPEFVDSSVGALAAPHSSRDLAAAIVSLYERDLDAVGAVARARVLRHYTWSRSFQAQLSTYASLVGVHHAPSSLPAGAVQPLISS